MRIYRFGRKTACKGGYEVNLRILRLEKYDNRTDVVNINLKEVAKAVKADSRSS